LFANDNHETAAWFEITKSDMPKKGKKGPKVPKEKQEPVDTEAIKVPELLVE
jgi:hypothetical protein